MIAGVRSGDVRILAAGSPIELAGFDDHAAQGGAVATDELRGGVDDDVGTVFKRPDQVRSAEGVVHHDGQTVLVGDLRDRVQIRNVAVRVAKSLQIDRACVVLDRIL